MQKQYITLGPKLYISVFCHHGYVLFSKSIIPEDSKSARRVLKHAGVKRRFKAICEKNDFFDLDWEVARAPRRRRGAALFILHTGSATLGWGLPGLPDLLIY